MEQCLLIIMCLFQKNRLAARICSNTGWLLDGALLFHVCSEIRSLSYGYVEHGLQRMYGSLMSLIMKQQQHKARGMEIELVQAKNAVEQSGKGKSSQSTIVAYKCTYTSGIRIWKASAWLYYY